MKKNSLLVIIFTILSFQTYSQISFEKGYFITEADQQVDAFIKNMDWKDNPKEFEYRLSENDPVQKADIKNIKEFGIGGDLKFVRATVNIDRSGDDLSNMSSDRNPVFQEEMLFLKTLVEGKASLFLYKDGVLTRFFYNVEDSPIQQLVYKPYLIDYDKKVARNNTFRQQIFMDLSCEEIREQNVRNIDYSKSDLKKVFVNYNKCANSEYVKYELKEKRDFFNLSIRPGLNYSSLNMKNSRNKSKDADFGSNLTFRFGVELEFVLPYNKNKWGIIIEPTYQYFDSEHTGESNDYAGGLVHSKLTYRSIELPIGLRHYFFLNDDSRIYADVTYILDNNIGGSEIEFTRDNGSLIDTFEIKSKPNIGVGVGYMLDRYSIGVRYQTSREILGNFVFWDSDYNTYSVIFGYSIF